ncbi:hypothetical protein [Actinoplanes solisilvae]|uniref:hypothetical protein n=1 Tax=Actinoplanes solisilvae TaxID=2486853 RepID=UPI000FD7EC07|nr:hypothetical protein [Actinoplanes solisilvae]
MSEVEVLTATVRLYIENTYEFFGTQITTPTVTVTLPVPDEGTDDRETWEYDNVFAHTGVGHTDGDSWYDVMIVESSAPELVGLTFEFGY